MLLFELPAPQPPGPEAPKPVHPPPETKQYGPETQGWVAGHCRVRAGGLVPLPAQKLSATVAELRSVSLVQTTVPVATEAGRPQVLLQLGDEPLLQWYQGAGTGSFVAAGQRSGSAPVTLSVLPVHLPVMITLPSKRHAV